MLNATVDISIKAVLYNQHRPLTKSLRKNALFVYFVALCTNLCPIRSDYRQGS